MHRANPDSGVGPGAISAEGDIGSRPPAELSDTLGGGSRRFVLPKRCFVMTNLVPGSVWGKPRSSIAKTCMRSSGRGVACGFQAKANGSQAQKVRLGARRGGVLC